ncbi:TPA: hypothetical protein QB271_001185 [Pasteurella multocida]|nr:hypothetical protein [Pasteurella multocida]HDR1193076.1 hypothetical protein [Pasteurella multocida]
MDAVQLAKELKVIVVKNQTDEYLTKLFDNTISKLEDLSAINSSIIRTYEHKEITPILNSIKNGISSNEEEINLENHLSEFIELYSIVERLHAAFVENSPLVKELVGKLDNSFNEKIAEFDAAFNKKDTDFSSKLTSIQTALGNAQANASSIETMYRNASTSSSAIANMESEYNTEKTNYIEQKNMYDDLISSIKSKEKEIENLKTEIDEIKDKKSTELNNLQNELEAEKEKIKDILGLANMASMAKSFLDRKKELDAPIESSAEWRNWGLIILFAGISGLLYFEFYIGFDYVRFVSRLPLSLPLIWLIWTNTQRNNHLVRVQEEYAYKAAVATAFEGYQRKVDELEERDLKKLLLELSVRNMGDNPVRLFDKNVKNSPFEFLFEKLSPEKNKKEDK